MRTIFTVFGLGHASYDTNALGLHSITSFVSQQKAEEWVTEQFAIGEKIESGMGSYQNVVILPVLSKKR
jgi:hypothetical protein